MAARNNCGVTSWARPPTWTALLEERMVGSEAAVDVMVDDTYYLLFEKAMMARSMVGGWRLVVGMNPDLFLLRLRGMSSAVPGSRSYSTWYW